MTRNWKRIWDERSAENLKGLVLADLIRLDGFDSGAGLVSDQDWRVNAAILSEKLGICDGQSVFEVGCGSGAFVFALREICAISVGGIDYSKSLVSAASQVMSDGEFETGDASILQTMPRYDYVLSHCVFHYFAMDYAEEVLERMLQKAKTAIGVLEVPDLRTRDESEAMRRDALSQAEYERKYAGLEHTYYSREWFVDQAAKRGLSCEMFGSCMPNSMQNNFRFNCLIRTA